MESITKTFIFIAVIAYAIWLIVGIRATMIEMRINKKREAIIDSFIEGSDIPSKNKILQL